MISLRDDFDFLPPPESEPEDTSEGIVWTSADIAMWKEIFAKAFAPPPPEP